ncbi:MAG: MFS transporter [Acetobacteraceae bacterium]|nr:MFS transporter [Acetobacteraceae bacterium]
MSLPLWQVALATTILVQTANSFLARMPAILAPDLTRALSVPPEAIGVLSAATMAGSILFLVAGMPLILRTGPIRALQVGLALGAAGCLMLMLPLWGTALLGAFLMGLGYGPSAPAASNVLQRHAPAAHRNLVFSVKQAGVPLGGVIAGLLLPPLASADLGLAIAAAALAVAAAAFAAQGGRARIDTERHAGESLSLAAFLSRRNLLGPFRAVAASPGLLRIALSGCGFAIGQGAWFAFLVTYLVLEKGYDLALAGLVFALTQVAGVFGRIGLGWLSDRLGSGLRTLRLLAVLSGATLAATGLAGPWPFWAVGLFALLGGVTVSSWNGLVLAEIARFAAPGRIAEATSGGVLVTFLGYIVGPAGFAALLAAGLPWGAAFAAAGALVGAAALLPIARLAEPRAAA